MAGGYGFGPKRASSRNKERGPGPLLDRGLDGRGQCRVSAPTASFVSLLHHLAVQREVETITLYFGCDT